MPPAFYKPVEIDGLIRHAATVIVNRRCCNKSDYICVARPVHVARDGFCLLDRLLHRRHIDKPLGVVDIDFALAVMRAVQPVEVCHAVCNAFRVFIHNVHTIVDEILCTAADRLYIAQSVRVVGISCGIRRICKPGLLPALVVGVGLVSCSQRVAVCITAYISFASTERRISTFWNKSLTI